MSPNRFAGDAPSAVEASLRRVWSELGERIRDERRRRRWTTARLAREAGISRTSLYLAERGDASSMEVVIRALTALGLRLEVDAADPQRRARTATTRTEDPVHAFMGELEASHLRARGFEVGIDEPYQHYQFAGRADVVAWERASAALIHLENRTRFPNVQEMAGSWNAKRSYLAAALGERLGIRFRSVTHVMVAAWTSEVLHVLRLHPASFRALTPDAPAGFSTWWSGSTPPRGISSTLVVLDPVATERQRPWVGLETALSGVRPRHRGYADLAAAITARGEVSQG